MNTLRTDLSLFWQESAIYIALYAGFAIIACLFVGGLELHNHTSQVSHLKLVPKTLSLALSTTLLFGICLFIVSWRSKWFGGEILSCLVMGAIWYGLLYWLNSYWQGALGLGFAKPALYAHMPVAVLVLPYIVLNAVVFVLGSAFHI